MRIYKGSEITLKLYTRINCQSIEADKMRVVLFTTNPNNSYMVNNVVVSGNTLLVTVGRNDLNAMEDGVINYIILGYDDNEEIYNSTRQSNYYLKTPDGYVAKSVQTSKDVYIVDNGEYKILPDEDYSSIEEVNVHVEFDAEPYIQRGFELGVETQKSKLESISITENGTYTREDGYNEIHVEVPDLNGDYQTGYDEGYEAGIDYASENAGEIAAQTARVLDVTENGSYLSQYSEPVYPDTITGVYPDGTNFYDYAKLESIELEGIKYDTELIPTLNTKVEFWFKPTSHPDNSDRIILGVQTGAEGKSVFKAFINSRFVLGTEIGGTGVQCQLDENWHHIEMSFADGLWVDGEKIGDYTANISGTFNLSFGINYLNDVGLTKYNLNNGNDSTFGMIKITIDDVENVIIPTAEGFKNITTNKLLKKASPYKDIEEVYDYTETTLTDSNPVTGVYDDGTEFYSYTSLNGKVFDTGIPVAEDSKIDFWWNDNNESYDNYYVNVGAQESRGFIFKICKMSNNKLQYEYGYNSPQSGNFQITKGEWHHFVMSKQEGLFVDDVLVTTINNDFQTDNYPTFHINASYDNENTYNANGLYGMIKITSNGVENIIIPTADGFKNITTDEMLTIKREGTYQYTNITSSGKEDIQTGDGDFYSNVKLNNMCFDTGIDATRDTRIEFWYKPIFKNMFEHYYYYGILSNNNSKPLSSTDREFGIMGNYSDNSFYAKLGYMYKNIILNDWNHIIMSGDEGVIVNGTKVGVLMKLDPFNLRLYINCNGDKAIATGYYGMIKINDTIIIPTPNGFLNTNTGEYLTQVPFDKYLLGYNFTEQKIIYPEGNLIKEVHVNVKPEKIDVGNNLKFYFSRFYIVPDYFDFSNTTDGDQLFQNSWLRKIPESLDTSKLTTAASTFSSTSVPDEDFYNLNFENCFNFSEPFGSRGIKDYSFLTNWNMPSTAAQNQIVKNGDVEYIPALYNTGRNGGYYASSIIQSYSDLTKLTYFGGYIGRTESMESNYALNKCPNLSYESCKSILENLYDFTGNGEVPNSSQGKLKVHSNFLTTIGDEISIATDKGWNVYS